MSFEAVLIGSPIVVVLLFTACINGPIMWCLNRWFPKRAAQLSRDETVVVHQANSVSQEATNLVVVNSVL